MSLCRRRSSRKRHTTRSKIRLWRSRSERSRLGSNSIHPCIHSHTRPRIHFRDDLTVNPVPSA
jgi:hypothetical protein